jgi:hypothetical protein
MDKNRKVKKLNAIFQSVPDLEGFYTLPNGDMSEPEVFSGTRIDSDTYTEEQIDDIFRSIMNQVNTYNTIIYQTQKEKVKKGKVIRMKGTGIVKPYEQSIKHLIDKPIEKVKPYTAFGRYYINKQRLKDKDIVALRYASGNVIAGMPAQKVSKPLAGVFHTLIGGGLPSYEQVNSLSQDEKSKLSAICARCGVDSPAVPHMKGEGEAEMDKFNVLRGEIIAGNDAPKIAREFKTMLLKFMNEGRIPKAQGNSILHEMLSLGV